MKRGRYITFLACFALAMFAVCFNRLTHKGYSLQLMLVLYVIAPLLEEFFFRYLPINFGRKHNLVNEFMWLSTFVFAYLHAGGYENFGVHYALIVQGTFGLFAWYTCKSMGYWKAVMLHVIYNLFVTVAI